ncbi:MULTISPECIES: LysR family transcriptional regulator [Ensifer]|uniref:LysR family transcriptional regulator n=1 Tax=Ensifer TaxID=106591 RepID=UPI000571DAB7|nr:MULTISPECIES: LysR family transcriptional regulator [Ensifer]KQY72568.1 LysR family transcriptional regulator [Ensifer sp. Root142]MBD9489469.1 LysR family transcriptional regulator [Ensifer sp. ENS11]MDP9632697.1 DNA-binding transcriptional LysR family regulator [Ensifer adhaerens]NOV17782.1 LysR family transcriptional regulator [Ensifer canadensis]
MSFNLKRLEYFLAVAEELHFGRAAERLDMAQPPLSRQIMQLEEEFGATLFDRGRGQIRLTQAGEALLRHARDMIERMEDARLEVRRIDQGAQGRLRIGFVGSATHGILPNLIKSFRRTYPEVNLILSAMNNAQQHRALIRREIDIAIARPELKDAEIKSVPFHEEPLILASSDTAMLETKAPIPLAALHDMPFILYPERPRPSFADVVFALCEAEGFRPKNRVFCMDYQTAISLVAVGEGVSIVPRSVGQTGHQGVRFLPLARADAVTRLSINYRIDNRERHIQRLLEIARKLVQKPDLPA